MIMDFAALHCNNEDTGQRAEAEHSMRAKWFGAAVKRKEDPALLAGKGRFIDDVRLPGTLHAAFVRSSHPHAKIRSVDTAAAKARKGVHLVLAFADLPEPMRRNSLPLFVPTPAITQLYMPYALP